MATSNDVHIDILKPEDHDAAARLIHSALVNWYETHLRMGAKYGDSHEPFRLIPEVYEALDPGEALAARDADTGELIGVCFVHPRETHVSVGIVATSPTAGGRGVARSMMEIAAERARAANLPFRLVSSLMNLDSFSVYSRIGFVPHTVYQDLRIQVPEEGMTVPPPQGIERVRLARPDEAASIANLEMELQGIRREKDFAFFLSNKVGQWKVWVSEDGQGKLNGVMVANHTGPGGMIGPGVATDETVSAALLWKALDAKRGLAPVFLVPSYANELVRLLYSWGGRNIELHAAQIVGELPQTRGVSFPTFLPESS